jgi:hypothetical protein
MMRRDARDERIAGLAAREYSQHPSSPDTKTLRTRLRYPFNSAGIDFAIAWSIGDIRD